MFGVELNEAELMSNERVIKSKINYFSFGIILLSGLTLTIIGVYNLLITEGSTFVVVLWSFLLFVGLVALYLIWTFDILVVYHDKLIRKSIFGWTRGQIDKTEIKSYSEIEKENSKHHEFGHKKWTDLTLFLKSGTYKITSEKYRNYQQIRNMVTSGVGRDRLAEKEWKRKNNLRWGIGLLILGGIFLWCSQLEFWTDTDSFEAYLIFGFILSLILYGLFRIFKNKKAP